MIIAATLTFYVVFSFTFSTVAPTRLFRFSAILSLCAFLSFLTLSMTIRYRIVKSPGGVSSRRILKLLQSDAKIISPTKVSLQTDGFESDGWRHFYIELISLRLGTNWVEQRSDLKNLEFHFAEFSKTNSTT